jgi:hypothetical protein
LRLPFSAEEVTTLYGLLVFIFSLLPAFSFFFVLLVRSVKCSRMERSPCTTEDGGLQSNRVCLLRAVEAASAQKSPSDAARAPPSVRVVSAVNLETVPAIPEVLNSPRSLAACKTLGILPQELQKLPFSHFQKAHLTEAIARLRFEHYEGRRQDKLAAVIRIREESILGELGVAPIRSATHQDPCSDAGPTVKFDAGGLTGERLRTISSLQQRRKEAYNRAKDLAAQRERRLHEAEVAREIMAKGQLERTKEERERRIEMQRLKREDHMENVDRAKRIAALRTAEKERSIAIRMSAPIDRYRILAAQKGYLTPRDRRSTSRDATDRSQ